MMQNRSLRVVAFVLAIALIGYGGMSVYRQHHMVDTYETTNGTVVATSIHSEQDTKPSLFGDSKSYYPAVKYSDSVGGTSYSNDNIYSSAKRPGGSGEQSKAARFLSKFRRENASSSTIRRTTRRSRFSPRATRSSRRISRSSSDYCCSATA